MDHLKSTFYICFGTSETNPAFAMHGVAARIQSYSCGKEDPGTERKAHFLHLLLVRVRILSHMDS